LSFCAHRSIERNAFTVFVFQAMASENLSCLSVFNRRRIQRNLKPFHRIKRPPVGKPVLAGYLVAVSGSGVSGGLEAFISREHHANPRGTPERLGWRAVLPELDGNNRLRFR
jgi:hypothetical protein